MNIQVGDIIKLENNQPVTVSTSLGCGFFFFGWSEYRGALFALPLALLLVTFTCLVLHPEINSARDKLALVHLSL